MFESVQNVYLCVCVFIKAVSVCVCVCAKLLGYLLLVVAGEWFLDLPVDPRGFSVACPLLLYPPPLILCFHPFSLYVTKPRLLLPPPPLRHSPYDAT